jgi:hypothetical protein
MADVADLLARAKRRETTAAVCLAGDLNAEHEELSRQLQALGEAWTPDSLSAANPRRALAERITDLEQQMAEQVHVFRFRALSTARFRELQRAHPPREDAQPPERLFNVDTFTPVLVAACCVDPEFSGVEQVQELFDKLGQGAFDTAFTAAWSACTGASDVPKSALASATIRSTAPS